MSSFIKADYIPPYLFFFAEKRVNYARNRFASHYSGKTPIMAGKTKSNFVLPVHIRATSSVLFTKASISYIVSFLHVTSGLH